MSVRKRTWTNAKGEAKQAWVVDYTDAKGARRLETFERKKDADARWAAVQVELRQGVHIAESDSVTVKKAAEIWMKAVALGRNGRSPAEASTLRQYRQHIDLHIVPELGAVTLTKLSGPRVNAFRDHLLATLSRALAKKVLTSLKSIVREAQSQGLVVAAPALSVSIQTSDKSRHREEVEIPEVAEAKALLAKLDELAGQSNAQRAKAWRRYRAFICTAIYTGCRASELRGLPWEAVDLAAATIMVVQRADENGTIGSPKSSSSRRTINIPAPLVGTLREWKVECPPGALVFPNWQGSVESLANIYNRCWKPIQLATGLADAKRDPQGAPILDAEGKPVVGPRYNLHTLRHFRASLLIADGANPKEVQTEMGHSTITVTFDLYGHLFKDDAADKVRRERAERLALSLA